INKHTDGDCRWQSKKFCKSCGLRKIIDFQSSICILVDYQSYSTEKAAFTGIVMPNNNIYTVVKFNCVFGEVSKPFNYNFGNVHWALKFILLNKFKRCNTSMKAIT